MKGRSLVVALLLAPPVSFREPALQVDGQIAVSRLVAPPVRHKPQRFLEKVWRQALVTPVVRGGARAAGGGIQRGRRQGWK